MALKIKKQFDGKLEFKCEDITLKIKEETIERQLYCKITNISGSKVYCNIEVNYSSDDININKTFSFVPNMDSDNHIKQGYDYLKTLEEFKDAKDC